MSAHRETRDTAPARPPVELVGVVRVDTPSRLQMGLLDLRGDLGRLFGGIGLALREPRTVVEASPAEDLAVTGVDADRARAVASRVLARWNLPGAALHVHRGIPAHAGLGSGTQLALAVARAVAESFGLAQDLGALVAATGRAARSGVGSWTFERGGLVVDGGHRANGVTSAAHATGSLPPLLVRMSMPASWRCVVLLPSPSGGLAGADERDAFARLRMPDPDVTGEIARVVLLGILPAVAEADLAAFGRAVSHLQELVGDTFAALQGSRFASPAAGELVRRLIDEGAAGAGQSSWGPAVYAFVDGDAAAARLLEKARDWIAPDVPAFATGFDDRGAVVRRIPPGSNRG